MLKCLFFIPPLCALLCVTAITLRPAERLPQKPAAQPETIAIVVTEPLPEKQVIPQDWRLILVNRWNPLPEGYVPALTQLKNEQAVDERCYPALQEMMDDCRAAGLEPLICSSYRTWEKQQRLFDNKVSHFVAKGLSEESARTEASKVVAVPGTSEHQLGLAVDIVDMDYQLLDDAQADTRYSNGCWNTAGSMALSCGTPLTKRRSPALFTSPGTIAMWAKTTQKPSGIPACVWKNG